MMNDPDKHSCRLKLQYNLDRFTFLKLKPSKLSKDDIFEFLS